LSISTFFELRDGASNVLYSRVGVAASPANMSGFVIPRIREVAAGLDVGFALVNTGTTAANPDSRTEGLRGQHSFERVPDDYDAGRIAKGPL